MATDDLFCELRIEAQERIQRVFVGPGVKVRLLSVDNDLLPAYFHIEARIRQGDEDSTEGEVCVDKEGWLLIRKEKLNIGVTRFERRFHGDAHMKLDVFAKSCDWNR